MSPETLIPPDESCQERGSHALAPSGSEGGREGAWPPYSNRGVYPHGKTGSEASPATRFDAYCSTAYEQPGWLVDQLRYYLELAGEKVTIDAGPPVQFYEVNKLLLDRFGKRLCSVRWGGQNGHPFVECKGHMAPVVADVLRQHVEHRPSRLDAARDQAAPGLFDRYVRLTRQLARKYGLKWQPKGDWVTIDAGRTVELGSRASQYFLRVYEKGLEMAARQGLPVTDDLRQLVRCEVEFKPQKSPARIQARTIAPEALWGLSDWLVEFADKAFSMEVRRVNVSERRESDHERALRFMAQQYRTHLERLLEDCGGDLDAFALEILHRAGLVPERAS